MSPGLARKQPRDCRRAGRKEARSQNKREEQLVERIWIERGRLGAHRLERTEGAKSRKLQGAPWIGERPRAIR